MMPYQNESLIHEKLNQAQFGTQKSQEAEIQQGGWFSHMGFFYMTGLKVELNAKRQGGKKAVEGKQRWLQAKAATNCFLKSKMKDT